MLISKNTTSIARDMVALRAVMGRKMTPQIVAALTNDIDWSKFRRPYAVHRMEGLDVRHQIAEHSYRPQSPLESFGR